tara:strand:- start:16033 stop:17973 length:1941 start_codon:yes stop_codon:yes gene_type:complete
MNKLQLVYDLEVYPNYFLATFCDVETGDFWEYELGDKLLNDIIRNPEVELIGFNNHHYDDVLLNFIGQHSHDTPEVITGGWGNIMDTPKVELDPKTIFELSERIINGTVNTIHEQQIKNAKYQDKEYSSIDLKALLDPMPSLKKLELRMQFTNVQDLPIKPGTILTTEQKQDIKIYCRNDVNATRELLLKHSLKHIELRKFLSTKFKLPISQLQSASEPRAAEYILANLAAEGTKKTPWKIKEELAHISSIIIQDCIPPWISFKTPNLQQLLQDLKEMGIPINNTTGYAIGTLLKKLVTIGDKDYQMGIGGLHSVDQPAHYTASANGSHIIDADVTSYYPSILLRDGLHPRGYSRKWAEIYQQVYDDRIEAKSDPSRTTEAHALKIILNATFGKFGSQYSSFYDPTLLVRVTLTGQLGLLMLIESLELEGIKVISANTDGVVSTPTDADMEAFNRVCTQWEADTKLNLEYTHYSRLARRDVNNYTALTTNNKVKNKGLFTPPDIKHDVKAPIIQRIARQCLLYNSTVEEAIQELHEELSIYDFLFSFGATKAFNIYLHNYTNAQLKAAILPQVNLTTLSKTNRWYISHNSTQRLSKYGGKNVNWVSIPDAENIILMNQITNENIPTDLNWDYYKSKITKLIKACGA